MSIHCCSVRNVYRLLEAVGYFTTILCKLDLYEIHFLFDFFLQIMDPKMDSGIASTYYSLDEAIENGAAPVPISADKTTDVRCLIDIMDHLLACEVLSLCCFCLRYILDVASFLDYFQGLKSLSLPPLKNIHINLCMSIRRETDECAVLI